MNPKILLTLYLTALADRLERELDQLKIELDPSDQSYMLTGLENLEVEMRNQIDILTGETQEENVEMTLSFENLTKNIAALERQIKTLVRD